MIPTCVWAVGPADEAEPCGAPVAYTMEWDGKEKGATKVRRYKPFCEEHLVKAIIADCRDEYGDAHDEHMRINGECPWCGTSNYNAPEEG
jgi:hypothetical protein